jgi:hypothetical protein
MKLCFLTTVLAGVSIVNYVVASPMHVVVISGPKPVGPHIFFEPLPAITSSVADQTYPPPPELMIPEVVEAAPGRLGRRPPPCIAAMLKEKATAMSNSLKQALGFPLPPPGNEVQTLPFMVLDGKVPPPPGHPHRHGGHQHHHKHHHHHHHHRGKSFMMRVHRALMALGPWEGRAMAFVLGCGIGVLLRMIWVMTVVTYRMIKGPREEPRYIEIVCDAEEIVIPPPFYVSEKGDYVEGIVDTKTPADAT